MVCKTSRSLLAEKDYSLKAYFLWCQDLELKSEHFQVILKVKRNSSETELHVLFSCSHQRSKNKEKKDMIGFILFVKLWLSRWIMVQNKVNTDHVLHCKLGPVCLQLPYYCILYFLCGNYMKFSASSPGNNTAPKTSLKTATHVVLLDIVLLCRGDNLLVTNR